VIDALWSDWVEVRVQLAIGSSSGADPTFTLDDPTFSQLDYAVLGSPTAPYVDVTCDVRQVAYRWGATRTDGVLTRWEAASATVVLDNNDAQYPIGGDDTPLVPMIGLDVQARIVQPTVGAWVPLFTGYVNAYLLAFDPHTLDCTVTLQSTDATALLSAYNAPAQSPLGEGDTASQRVDRILTEAEWTGARDLQAGGRIMAATTLANDAWTELLLVNDSELGAVFIAPSGAATFRTRETVMGAIVSSAAPVADWGPGASQLRYEDVVTASDDTLLKNIVDAARPSGTQQTARDGASVSKYLPHRWGRNDLALDTDGDVQAWASLVLQTSSVPFRRVDALTVTPQVDPAHLWPIVLATAYLDRWHVDVDPAVHPVAISTDALVRGWAVTLDRVSWTVTYALSSTAGFAPFILDDPNNSQLDLVRLG
jgi:hypothetical protein